MCTGCTQAEPPTLLLMSHSSVVPRRMQWAECSGSNTHPSPVSNGLLILNKRGVTVAGSRTNCHSQLLSVAGNGGYVVSVAGIGGVSGGNHGSRFTTLNCSSTFSIARPGGSGSGDGLPTNIALFSLRYSF